MTPEERAKLVPKGLYVKYKCDGCGRAIMTPLSFTGDNGEDYCSRACRDGAPADNKPKERSMKEEKAKKAKREESDEAEPIKKKKRPVEAEEEDVKKAKKSKKVEPETEDEDDEEEATPAKSKKSKKSKKAAAEREYKPVVPKGKNPYNKVGSVSYEFFEKCKKGASIKELNAFIEEAGVAPARLWREIRSGGIRGMKWRVVEDKKTIQVVLLKSK